MYVNQHNTCSYLSTAVCGPKFVKFWDRRYSPLSLKVVEKPNKCKKLARNIFGRYNPESPTFLRQIVSTIYCRSFSKVWFSSVCWSPSAKPGNDV